MSIYSTGKNMISLFYALAKAAQVYDIRNDVVIGAAKKFGHILRTLLNIYPQIELVRYREYVFFNKQRLRFEIDGYASLQFVHDKMKRLRLRSIIFLPGINEEELILLCLALTKKRDEFPSEFNARRLAYVTVEYADTEESAPDFLEDGQRVKRTYFKALKVTKNLMNNLWKNQAVDVKSSKRVVYGLVNALSQDEFGLLALTAIKNFDEYTYNHSLNVGILALAVGQRIGFGKKDLARIGTAGILHDIGKVSIPKDLIYKPTRLSEPEWEIIKRHSEYGVKQIIKTRGLDETGMISLIVAYQHHWNYNYSGYPRHDKNLLQSMFAKIVRICDSYDAMTTARVYQPLPYIPSIAIRVIWRLAGECFDPVLVKVFVQLLGIYPVGSCLEMNDGFIGLVLRQNEGHPAQPTIKILATKQKDVIDGPVIDLSVESDRRVVRAVYPQPYGINPAEHIV